MAVVLPAGDVSQYGIIRVMPFGGNVLAVGIKGSVLAQALTQGLANRGSGGFLQTANVSRAGDTWMTGAEPRVPARPDRMSAHASLVPGGGTGSDRCQVRCATGSGWQDGRGCAALSVGGNGS